MKIISISISFFILLFSCNNSKKVIKDTYQIPLNNNPSVAQKVPEPTNNIYFKATGTEPFWDLEISKNRITLHTMEDTIVTPHSNPIRVADANIKRYNIETEATNMSIQISQKECVNAMSGEAFPYTVEITFKKTSETNSKVLEGCGQYITDYRLHDIWVLKSLNGKTVSEADFPKELPSLEINTNENRFAGFAGCNRINGSLFYENGLLRFTKIATTLMMCEPNNKEPEFLKALQSTTTYSIEDNQLQLMNPNGALLVFQKID